MINEATADDLNNTIKQLDLTDIFRTLHQTIIEYTFFSSAHEACSRIYHMLNHKTTLNKSERTEIIKSMFSNTNEIKLNE